MATLASFDDLRKALRQLPEPDLASIEACRSREAQLTKPSGALGRLEAMSAWLCGWQGRHPPRLADIRTIIFAGSHGVTARGISTAPAAVNKQMVANFRAGGAAINQLSNLAGARLEIVPMEIDLPTRDFSKDPAMSEAECLAAFAIGHERATSEPADLLILGEMGIGNTTSAAAICAALYGEGGSFWAGPGTGLDRAGVARKAAVIDEALAQHHNALVDPLAILRYLGGREIAALAGAIAGARQTGTPVLLDGFVVKAAAAVFHAVNPRALEHCQAGHISAEPGDRVLLEHLGLAPLLDLAMRLGEGSGAAVAALVLKAAIACHNGMATFEEAGVSR